MINDVAAPDEMDSGPLTRYWSNTRIAVPAMCTDSLRKPEFSCELPATPTVIMTKSCRTKNNIRVD